MSSLPRRITFLCVMAVLLSNLPFASLAHAQDEGGPTRSQPPKLSNFSAREPGLGMFNIFIDNAGEEDERIQVQTQAGKVDVTPRRDYAAGIGISKEEEQTILAIVIDGYHRGGGSYEDKSRTCDKFIVDFGPDEGRTRCATAAKGYDAQRYAALTAAVEELRKRLTNPTFAKLDVYVNRRGWIDHVEPSKNYNPCPVNNNPGPHETRHLACRSFYDDLITSSWKDEYHNESIGQDSEESKAGRWSPVETSELPVAVQDAAIAVGAETYRRLQESDAQAKAAGDEYLRKNSEKYGSMVATQMLDNPRDPEAIRVWKLLTRRYEIVEEFIADFRAIVGDDYFSRVDEYLSKRNKWAVPDDTSAPSVVQNREQP